MEEFFVFLEVKPRGDLQYIQYQPLEASQWFLLASYSLKEW